MDEWIRLGSLWGVPDGNAVSPPELAANAPVLDVLKPVVVNFFPALGEETDESIAHGVTGLNGLWVLEEPLLAQARFDRHIRTLAEADIVLVGFLLGEESQFLEALDGLHACLESVKAGESISRQFVERPVGIHDVDDRQIVTEADLVVGLVVGRSDLEHAGPEFKVDRFVANDRKLDKAVEGQGAADMFADEVGVALILGIHGDRSVSHDGLRAGGGDLQPDAGVLHDLKFEVVEVSFLFLGNDLLVAQRGEGDRAPVNHPLAPVDESLVVEIDEDFLHLAGIRLVHCEALTGPVAGATELLELPYNDAAVLLLPFPDTLEELFATEVMAGLFLFFAQFALHDGLRCNAGVIGARKPEDLVAGLSGPTSENVLKGVVEDVAKGQDAGDIWRWDDN